MKIRIAGREYDFSSRVHLLGILNLTPDSFSDGGLYIDPVHALDRALQMQEGGADFIDIGAESTRPNAPEVSAEEQILRLKKVLPSIALHLKVPVSLDTRYAAVAQWGLEHGVSLINDVSGLTFDPKMMGFLVSSGLPFILMHSRGTPETMRDLTHYQDIVLDLILHFNKNIEVLENEGILLSKIILDPGLGFAKTPEQNVEILGRLKEFRYASAMGDESFTTSSLKTDAPKNSKSYALSSFPLLIGLSRKSFLKSFSHETLEMKNPYAEGVLDSVSMDQSQARVPPSRSSALHSRQTATEIAHAIAILNGANLLRVHEVGLAKKTATFIEKCRSFR